MTTDAARVADAVKRTHHANLRTSKRLQKLAAMIYSRTTEKSGPTSLEIIQWTFCVNLTAAISELRMNGIHVECELAEMKDDGTRIYRYRIEHLPEWLRKVATA